MRYSAVIGVAHDGEAICWECMTNEEHTVAKDEEQSDDISPLFAGHGDETCGRCGKSLMKNTP